MPNKNDEFLQKLIATFRVEADEHIRAMSSGITELAQLPNGAEQAETIERTFREAHSLKGAARAVNFTTVASVCQAVESVFARLKDGSLALSSPLIGLMLEAVDELTTLLSADTTSQSGDRAVEGLIRHLDEAAKGQLAEEPARDEPKPRASKAAKPKPSASKSSAPEPSLSPEPTPEAPPVAPSHAADTADTIRVSTDKLNRVMRHAEELLLAKLSAAQRMAGLRDAETELSTRKKIYDATRPLLRTSHTVEAKGGIDEGQPTLSGLNEFLESDQLFIRSLENRMAGLITVAGQDHRALSAMVDGLLQEMREMLMLPFTSLLETFPYAVRELARDRGKQVELRMDGGEIEIDRRILEQMKDPFIHLLRNCVDHGIEAPKVRSSKGKPETGTISISVKQVDSGKVEITVADDGAGIDAAKVMAAAGKLGLVPEGEPDNTDDMDAIPMIFHSGVSTSPIISDISGRGLGLAIVRENVERLGGMVTINTQVGKGTIFRMVMPLTLATFRGVLVRAAGQQYAIPLHSVECVVRIPAEDVRTVENRETIQHNGQTISLVELEAVLGLGSSEDQDDHIQAVIIHPGFDRMAFQVEEVIGEQEVLVKMLGRQLARVRNVSGAALLGTGEVVPVLNVADLMKSAVQPMVAAKAATAEMESGQQRSILVVEDSITSRTLLKNILEAAGYRVVTAVDGIDAYTTLKTGEFDLVMSDVDMPRMNGFDLTAKIRADKQWSEIPVVLVTSLGTREHRERGIDVGANAYIVKSSFDQSNLLEVIERLV